jgi:subtilisin family serine protease
VDEGKDRELKKIAGVLLALFWLSMIVLSAAGADSPPPHRNGAFYSTRKLSSASRSKLAAGMAQKLSNSAPGSQMTVTVILIDQADLPSVEILAGKHRQQVQIEALQTISQQTQKGLRSVLASRQAQGSVSKVIPLWIFNGIVVTADAAVIRELAAHPDVFRIEAEQTFMAPPIERSMLPMQIYPLEVIANANIVAVNAPALWNLGFRGQGVVVGIMDSGVDVNHPDLSAQYRGGSNSWYDPYGENLSPADIAGPSTGHGTAVMSVILGRSASGSAIGVAPDATWIAAKIFNNLGITTTTKIHLAMQWILDPDGNPATPDAPQVLSNSWTYTSPVCDLSLQLDLQHLRAADILPIFSAGNFGPYPSTGSSPANYPEAFAVGAVDGSGMIASFSSRGPESCGLSASVTYPALVAPGVNIPVAAPGGGYTRMNGTSFAAPHVAGVLALLLSAAPDMTLTTQQTVLIREAVDQGPAGPDNDYGYGAVDSLMAYQSIQPMVQSVKVYFPLISH